ncbi:ribonuclease Oy-like isoform X2 [Rhodnius prolixus]|uniref:ribonuclease Oy-like isoform X2 n=1 Tax=Rhodnius prolixus TaxID=13249 RepID=UPI003D18D9E7
MAAPNRGEIFRDLEWTYEGSDEFEDQEVILKKHKNNEWDVLIFTQSWPPTDCLSWKQKSTKHKCRNLRDTGDERWTVHGIWPSKWGTHGPAFCNSSDQFNINPLNDLMASMNRQWPPIEKSGSGIQFWRHEWEKHGTCAEQLPELGSEHKYFKQGLDWNTMYNLEQWLSSGGITAGKDYELTEIWEAVTHTTGVDPHIFCFKDHKKNKNYLQEIRLCFNKKLSLIDCKPINGKKTESSLYTKIVSHSGMCDIHSPVVYPSVQDVQPTFH